MFKNMSFQLFIVWHSFLSRCTDFAVQDKTLDHPPIYNYKEDPYMQLGGKSHLPDIVIQGVLMGLYGNFQ